MVDSTQYSDFPNGLTLDELNALPDADEEFPNGLTLDELNALPDAPAVTAPELSGTETFARGIADTLGGRYIAPAIGSLIKHGDLSGFREAQEFYDAPQSGMRTAGQVAGMLIPGAVASRGVKFVGSMPKLAAVGNALGTGFKGNVARGVAQALGETAVMSPYATVTLQGKLPSTDEFSKEMSLAAGLGTAIPAVGSTLAAGKTLYNRFRPGKYRTAGLSAGYGEGLGGAEQLKFDRDALQEVKRAVASGDGSEKEVLTGIISKGPDEQSLLRAAANNPEQRPVVQAMLRKAKEQHPATAEAFAREAIDPNVAPAASEVRRSIGVRTRGVGTERFMVARRNELDRLYGIAEAKLNASDPIPLTDVYSILTEFVDPKTAENVVAHLVGKAATGSAGVLNAGMGDVIRPQAIANYVRGITNNPLDFQALNRVGDGLSEVLTRRAGAPEFKKAFKGWADWYAMADAVEAGKGAVKLNTARDISARLSSNPHSKLAKGVELRAKQTGMLDGVLRAVDNGEPVVMSKSMERTLRETMPDVADNIDRYNYWVSARKTATASPVLQTQDAGRSAAFIASRLAWGRKAGEAAGIGAFIRRIQGLPTDKQASETMARLLNAPKGDWKAIMQNTTYKSRLDELINKALNPAVIVTTTLNKEER